jgi:glutaredoxin
VQYLNVKDDPKELQEMLKLSKGLREVPVIVERGAVTIGWEGNT